MFLQEICARYFFQHVLIILPSSVVIRGGSLCSVRGIKFSPFRYSFVIKRWQSCCTSPIFTICFEKGKHLLTALRICVMTAKIRALQSGSLLQHRNLNGLTLSREIFQHTF